MKGYITVWHRELPLLVPDLVAEAMGLEENQEIETEELWWEAFKATCNMELAVCREERRQHEHGTN